MSISCIEILTPNLLENATLSESGNTKTYAFSAQTAINKIIIKNTNLTALTIEYKTTAEGDFSTITPTVESCGQDFIFTFPSVINILILKIKTQFFIFLISDQNGRYLKARRCPLPGSGR